jgi:hypothetical protein
VVKNPKIYKQQHMPAGSMGIISINDAKRALSDSSRKFVLRKPHLEALLSTEPNTRGYIIFDQRSGHSLGRYQTAQQDSFLGGFNLTEFNIISMLYKSQYFAAIYANLPERALRSASFEEASAVAEFSRALYPRWISSFCWVYDRKAAFFVPKGTGIGMETEFFAPSVAGDEALERQLLERINRKSAALDDYIRRISGFSAEHHKGE